MDGPQGPGRLGSGWWGCSRKRGFRAVFEERQGPGCGGEDGPEDAGYVGGREGFLDAVVLAVLRGDYVEYQYASCLVRDGGSAGWAA